MSKCNLDGLCSKKCGAALILAWSMFRGVKQPSPQYSLCLEVWSSPHLSMVYIQKCEAALISVRSMFRGLKQPSPQYGLCSEVWSSPHQGMVYVQRCEAALTSVQSMFRGVVKQPSRGYGLCSEVWSSPHLSTTLTSVQYMFRGVKQPSPRNGLCSDVWSSPHLSMVYVQRCEAALTYNANHQFLGGFIQPHQQGVVHDQVSGEEHGIIGDGCLQHAFGMGTKVQRAVHTRCNKRTGHWQFDSL